MKTRLLILLAALAGLLVPVAGVAPADASTCSNPRWVTSNPDGMRSFGPYVVHNNMWNASGYRVSETLSACSGANWRVRARANNNSGDGAVKTYPNVHRDYHNWNTGREPRVRSFKTIRSTFAARTPHVGIYNTAFDIWLNGIGNGSATEVMIWTDNYRQVPGGSVVARHVRLSGHRWTLYATAGNHYLAFKPAHRITHDTINIKAMLRWLMAKGRVSGRSTLGQICYGFEIVSTGGRAATFKVDRLSIRSTRR